MRPLPFSLFLHRTGIRVVLLLVTDPFCTVQTLLQTLSTACIIYATWSMSSSRDKRIACYRATLRSNSRDTATLNPGRNATVLGVHDDKTASALTCVPGGA